MIDPKLQDELRARFNPDGSLLRRHQLRMLEMLKYIDKVCQENDIPYWLSSGTCLGAVRHGGFIPWDDDVDIEMLGKDYDRLIEILEKNGAGDYLLQTHKTDPAYIIPFAKIRDKHSVIKENIKADRDYKFRGAFIDIFPLDPSSYKSINQLGSILIRICMRTNNIDHKTLRKACRSFIYFLTFQLIAPIARWINRMRPCNCLRHRFGSAFLKPRYTEDIFPLQRIQFDGIFVNTPHNTDSYLRKIYGNYMILPDVDTIKIHTTQITIFDAC